MKISGYLQVSGSPEGYTIIIEIMFDGETDPTYQFTATTSLTGYYERNFIHENGKEGLFTVWVNVLLHANPRNSTTYHYDETPPTVGTVSSLAPFMSTFPLVNWTASTDSQTPAQNITYSVYRVQKTVGVPPTASEYVLQTSTLKTTTWSEPGPLSSPRDTWYIVSARDFAGNSANYTAVKTIYDITKPNIVGILSPTTGGVYANTINITARITDSITFTAWAHVSNSSYNSTRINLSNVISDRWSTFWSIPTELDGPYNVYIHANDSLGNYRISSPVSFLITKQAPVFSNLDDNSPSYLESGNITVRIQEISGVVGNEVADVNLLYSTDNVIFTSVSMSLSSGNTTDGTWTGTIPKKAYYLYGSTGPRTRVYYKVTARNTILNNVNVSSTVYYDVEDYNDPDFLNLVRNPITVEFFRSVSIKVNVTKDINSSGVDFNIAYLEYRNGTGAWTNRTLQIATGSGLYNALFQSFFEDEKIPPFNFGDHIFYRVWARDRRGNWNVSSTFDFTVTDLQAPTIVNFGLLKTFVNYNETGRIYMNITDLYANVTTRSSGIQDGSISLNISINNGLTWHVYPMSKAYGDAYQSSWRFDVPAQQYNTVIRYRFIISDNQGNTHTSTEKTYTVVDQFAPTYSGFTYAPASPTYQTPILVSIVPSEPVNASGVNNVRLFFTNSSGTQGPFAMVNVSSTFTYTVPMQNYGQTITVTVEIFDKVTPTGNKRTVTGMSFYIGDTVKPTINSFILNDADGFIQYYERINVTVVATDLTSGHALPSAIKNVTLEYHVNGGIGIFLLMNLISGTSYNGIWNVVLPYFNYNDNISYAAFVYDNAGNSEYTTTQYKTIRDNNNPTFNPPTLLNAPIEYDEISNITIRLFESTTTALPAGIGVVLLNYSISMGAWQQVAFSRYSGTIFDGFWNGIIPGYYDYNVNIRYNVVIFDRAGNPVQTSTNSYSIDDLDAPVVNSIDDGATQVYYQVVTVTVNASEVQNPAKSSGIVSVTLNYSVNSAAQIRLMLTRNSGSGYNDIWSVQIPAQDYNAIIRYNVTVTDLKGNKITTTLFSYTVIDDILPNMNVPVVQDKNNLDGHLEYSESIEIRVLVFEVDQPTRSSGISTVSLNYSVASGPWTVVGMSIVTGDNFEGTWSYTFSTNVFSWNQTIRYVIRATDLAGVFNVTSQRSFIIEDLQKPTAGVIKLENPPARYDARGNITVGFTEPSNGAGMKNVTIQYSTNGGVSWTSILASQVNGTIYSGFWSALLPYLAYGTSLQIRALAYDRGSNFRYTGIISHIIDDLVNPAVNYVNYDADCQYLEDNYILVNIVEAFNASGVLSVYVNYSVNNGAQTRLIASLTGGNAFNGNWTIAIPKQDYNSIVRFNYTIRDVKGNQVTAPTQYQYTVQDHVQPVLSAITFDDNNDHDGIIQYFEHAFVRITVSEVVTPTRSAGIFSVTINRTDDGIIWNSSPMNLQSGDGIYSGLYNFTFNARDWNKTVQFKIKVIDSAGNQIETIVNQFTSQDLLAATVMVPAIENAPVMYYMAPSIVVQVTEPVTPALASGINAVRVNYTTNGITWNLVNMTIKNGTIYNGYWNYSLPVLAYGTTVQYRIRGWDRAGNLKVSSTYSFSIGDNIAPSVVSHSASGSYLYYTPVTVNVTVTEPAGASGVSLVQLVYSVGGVLKTAITMSRISGTSFNGVYQGIIPVQDFGAVVRYNFTARDVATNLVTGALTTQYTVGDDRDPAYSTITLYDGNDGFIEYYEQAKVIIALTEETTPALSSGIKNAILAYSTNNWITSTNITMTQESGINRWNGTWSCFIPALSWDTIVKYKIHVSDYADNHVITIEKNFTVVDLTDSIIGIPSIFGFPIEYRERINITVSVQEAINASGVMSVDLNYSYSTIYTTTSMGQVSGTSFNGIWGVNLSFYLAYGTVFRYSVIVRDNAGNIVKTSTYSFEVDDFINPQVDSLIQTDNGNGIAPIEYSERCILRITVSEPILPNRSSGIDLVQVFYDINASASWITATTVMQSYTILNYNELWNATILRQNYNSLVRYYIRVVDVAGNVYVSPYYNYTVADVTNPVVGTITVTNRNYYQNPYVSISVTEVTTPAYSSGVQLVRANVSSNGGSTWQLYTMPRISGTAFSGTYAVSLPSLAYGTVVFYKVMATDRAGNSAQTTESQFTITDDVRPTFASFTTLHASPNYNETQVIDVRIVEAVNASGTDATKVTLYYQNGTSTYSIPMTRLTGTTPPYLDNWWRASVPATTRYNTTISYWVVAFDMAGNTNTSSTRTYTVRDVFKVDIINMPVVTNAPVEYDQAAIIKLNATEPVLASGISIVRLRWHNETNIWNNVTMAHGAGSEYSGSVPVHPYGTIITWHVILVDVAGNILNYSTTTAISIVDTTDPVYVSYSTVPERIEVNQAVLIKAVFSEPAYASGLNTTLGSAKIHYDITPVTFNQVRNLVWNSSTGTFDFAMQAASAGQTVTFYFEIHDLAGNIFYTGNTSYQPGDETPPTISAVYYSTVVEYYNTLNVLINALDGQTGVQQVFLYYQINSTAGGWTTVIASLTAGTSANGNWTAVVPRQRFGSTIYFYVEARDGIGNNYYLGNVAAYSSSVTDTLLPTIDTIRVNGATVATADVQYYQNANITARVYKTLYPTLAAAMTLVRLNYSVSTGVWNTIIMTKVSGTAQDGVWSGVIPAQIPYNTKVNFTIYAIDQNSNSRTTTTSTFTITDRVAPVSSNLVVDGNMYYHVLNITIRIQKDSINASKISSVTLTYSVNSVPTGLTMTLKNGSTTSGYYQVSIGPFDYGSLIGISINCMDQAGNALSSAATSPSFTISDDISPQIVSITDPGTVYYYEATTIYARITEVSSPTTSSGIVAASVLLNYSTNGGASWIDVLMSVNGSFNPLDTTFYALIPEQDYGTAVLFMVQVTDVSGNGAEQSGPGFTVNDNTLPTISNYARLKTPTYYYESPVVVANLTEATAPRLSSGLKNATIHYLVDGSWHLVSMALYSGDAYTGTWHGTIPAYSYGKVIIYYVSCYDNAGNLRVGSFNRTFTVDDDRAPRYNSGVVISDTNNVDGFIEYNETSRILIQLYEDFNNPTNSSSVNVAILNYSVNFGPWTTIQRNSPMSGNRYDGWWNWSLVPASYGHVVRFTIIIRDVKGNQNVTGLYSYTVQDLRAPVIGIPVVSSPVYYHANGTIIVQVSERNNALVSYLASGVAQVVVNYSVNNGVMHTTSAIIPPGQGDAWDGYWRVTLPAFEWNVIIRYNITAVDNAGRRATSSNYQFSIFDDVAPTIETPVVMNLPIHYNQNATIAVQVTEPTSVYGTLPSGVTLVRYYYSINNIFQGYLVMQLDDGDGYNGNWSVIAPRFNYDAVISGYIWAEDGDVDGVPGVSSNFTFTIYDDTPPSISNIHTVPSVINYFDSVIINTRVDDGFGELTASSGVFYETGVKLFYQIGTNPFQQVYMTRINGTSSSGYFSYTIPVQPYGRVIKYYIYAEDIAGNGVYSGNYSYVVTDTVEPVVGTPSDNNPEYNQIPGFQVDVQEPTSASGVSQVFLHYSVNGGAVQTTPAILISGTVFSGTWRAETSMFNYGALVSYNFSAEDFEGNVQYSTNHTFVVRDVTLPVLSSVTVTNADVTYDEYANINVRAQDANSVQGTLSSGIESVYINYTATGWGYSLIRSMNLLSGSYRDGIWNVTLPHYFLWNTLVSFTIFTNDSAGNVRTITGSFTIYDYQKPTITNIQALDPLGGTSYEYNETITIRCRVSEAPTYNTSSGISFSSMYLYYRSNLTSSWSFKSLTLVSGNVYQSDWMATINPRPYNTTMHYFISASDNAGNEENSSVLSYYVGDIYRPTFSTIRLNGNVPGTFIVYYYNTLQFSITAIEDVTASGLKVVMLNYSINATNFQTQNMTLSSGTLFSGTWSLAWPAINYGTSVNYSFTLFDVANNVRRTPHYQFTVQDNVLPVLSPVTVVGDPVEYNDLLTLRITALEETSPARSSGLKGAVLNYTYNGIHYSAVNMTGTGTGFNRTYTYQVPFYFAYNTSIQYVITVSDLANNARVVSGSYVIRDVTAPGISGIQVRDNNNEDGDFEYDETLAVRVNATEAFNASGVSIVMFNYSMNGQAPVVVPLTLLSGTNFAGTWRASLGTFVYNTVISYNVTVVDTAGNRVISANSMFTIKDFDKPVFSTPRVNNGTVITYKDTIYFQVNVTKPSGGAQVASVNISIQIDAGMFQTFSATLVRWYIPGYNGLWQYVLSPQNAFTSIAYYFTAIDVAGNLNNTILRPRQVLDTFQPEISNFTLNGLEESTSWVFEYNQTITVSIGLLETWGVTNGSGISEVFLSYRSTGAEINYTRVLMVQTSGNVMNGTWEFTVPALQWSGTVYLKIEARDISGLEQNYLFQEYTTVQTDSQAPTITNVTILAEPDFPGYYDSSEPESFYTVNINATLTTLVNSSQVNAGKIFVQFKAITEPTWHNSTLLPTAAPNVFTAKIYGMAWRQNITYRVYAENNDGIAAINDTHSGITYLYYAVDRKAPAYSNPTIGVVRQEEDVDVSIDLFEPVNASGIDLSNVFVRFNITDTFTWKSNPLTNVGGGTFEGKIDPFSAGTVVYYHFYCKDIKGNLLIFPVTNYTYTIGDSKLPVYNDTATTANRPTQVKYMAPLNFSVYCYDEDSSISSILLTYSVGTGVPQTLTSFVKVPGATKQQDRYVFTIPGQIWKFGTEGTITIRILEITDSSSNTLDLRGSVVPFLVYIVDNDLPVLDNSSINVIDSYQTMYLNHSIILNFTAYEPSGASGLKNVTVVASNSTGDVKMYSFIDPTATQFSVYIPDQRPFTVITYYFIISDKAGNVLNTAPAPRSFKVDYFETRLADQVFDTGLTDPVNTTVDVLGFYLNPTTDMTIRVSEYDSNPNALGPRYTYHSIVSNVYRIMFNTSSAYLNETNTGEFVFYYDQAFLDSISIDESKLVLARYTPVYGYQPFLDVEFALDQANNRIIFSDDFVIRTLFSIAVGLKVDFVILGEYLVPTPAIDDPVLGEGSVLYGVVEFTIQTTSYAQNVSLYYRVGIGGTLVLIGHNISSGTVFTIQWNTTALGNVENIVFRLVATNPQGYSGVSEILTYFVRVHNIPDAEFSSVLLPAGGVYTGTVLLTTTSSLPASMATFFYYIEGEGTRYVIGVNSSMPSWDGMFPFVGTSTFTCFWNTSLMGDLSNVRIGVYLSSYAIASLNGTIVAASTKALNNVPSPATITLPGGSTYTGLVYILVTCDIPASSATFFYYIDGNSTQYAIGVNASRPAWDGYYPFTGVSTFSIWWNTSSQGDLDGVFFGVNLTHYYSASPSLIGTTLSVLQKTIRNIPDPAFTQSPASGADVYGNQTLSISTTIPGIFATFYYIRSGVYYKIGTVTSGDGGFTFDIVWDTTPVAIALYVTVYVEVTNIAWMNGTSLSLNAFTIRNRPEFYTEDPEGLLFIHDGLNTPIPDYSYFTGSHTLVVLLQQDVQPTPVKADYYLIYNRGLPGETRILLVSNTVPTTQVINFNTYYKFSYAWDTTDLLDASVQLLVNVTNEVGYSRLSNYLPINLRNVPVPTIVLVGPYVVGTVGGKTLNRTVPIAVTTPYYAAFTEFFLLYTNGSSIPMFGTITSPTGDNKSFVFNWTSWVNTDGVFVRIEARMYSIGGWSNLDIGTVVYSPAFDLVNSPVLFTKDPGGVLFIHDHLDNPIPDYSDMTGINNLTVFIQSGVQLVPVQADYWLIYNRGLPGETRQLLGSNSSPAMQDIDTNTYYKFSHVWDTTDLLDNAVPVHLVVNVTNEVGYSSLSNYLPVNLRNVPVPTIISVGPYASSSLAGRTLNGTVPVVVTTPYYAAFTEFYLIYTNATSVPMLGTISSLTSDNKTFIFNWTSWVNYDGQFVRIEVRMYSRGGYSNLDVGPLVQTSTFNILNIPQPVLVTSFIPSYNYFGNITITAYTSLNASSATFYYHNSTGDFQVNGNGVVLASSTADEKTFNIVWQSDLLNEMNGVYVYVIMHSLGGFPNRSANSNSFNLRNVPDPLFELVDQQVTGVISGPAITVIVNSTRFAQNATLYVVLDSTLYQVGFEDVVNITSTYFMATFTWNSTNFTQFVLSTIDSSRYDFDIYFYVDMRNAADRSGTINSSTFHVYNAPALIENLPEKLHGECLVTVVNTRSYVSIASLSVEFYNGSALVTLSLPSVLPNVFENTYDFSSFLPNATMMFTFKATTSLGIVFEMEVGPLPLNNTPVPTIIENFSIPGYIDVISGNVMVWANSSVEFTEATFYVVLSNGSAIPLAITTDIVAMSPSEYITNITFNTLTFTTSRGLPFDVEGIKIRVNMSNARGESSQALTSLIYHIHNAPEILVEVIDPESGSLVSPVQGVVLIVATNLRPYINETSASIVFWNGLGFDTVMMVFNSTGRYFTYAWDSRFVSDNASYALPITMTTDIGTDVSLVYVVQVMNGIDFVVFLPAGVPVHFDLMSHPVLKMMGDVIVTQNAYLKIFNTTQPAFSTFGNYYMFDAKRAFNITISSGSGQAVPFQLNFTMVYDYRAFSNFPGLKLNETSIALVKIDSSGTPSIVLGALNNDSKWITVTGLTSLSVFIFVATELVAETGPVVDVLSAFILIAAISSVVGAAAYATRPKRVKEQIIPGKKKACKNCGKYVKPYVTTCPYCNTKLTDEETLVEAMNKLSHLFIFHEESGVCLYYHPFTESKIDPQLISGFLSAITSFGGQFDDATKKKKDATVTSDKGTGSDLKELVYKEYRILMETSGQCKFAVLITGQASKILTFKISQFIKHFMRTYEDVLKDWKGNVRIFKDVEQMVRLIFGLTKVQDSKGKPAPQQKPASFPPDVKPAGDGNAGAPASQPLAPPKPPTAPGYPGQIPRPQKPAPEDAAHPPQGEPSRSVGLFELKGRIGQPGEPAPHAGMKPAPESPKDPFSPTAPPEKGKKKKK